jgi:hypothetical protein
MNKDLCTALILTIVGNGLLHLPATQWLSLIPFAGAAVLTYRGYFPHPGRND